jgi:cell wall-associated NlpC family hydrolase
MTQNKEWRYRILKSCLITIVLFCIGCGVPTTLPLRYHNVSTAKQNRLVETARSYIGTTYHYGGASRSGMDCSGLVVRVYREVYGLKLPHKTSLLYRKGKAIHLSALGIGDLVFFQYKSGHFPDHVGIYLGNGEFIHASSSRGVIISSIKQNYYYKRYIGARRLL